MYKKNVINYFSNALELSKHLNTNPAAVYQWGEIIPELRAFQVERITGGALKYDPSLYSKDKKVA